MAGQTNSWVGTMQISNIPCIGDTVRKRSSANEYYADGTPVYGDDGMVSADAPMQTASIWWWVIAGLAAGYLLKGRSR